jgi:hypothetical protein
MRRSIVGGWVVLVLAAACGGQDSGESSGNSKTGGGGGSLATGGGAGSSGAASGAAGAATGGSGHAAGAGGTAAATAGGSPTAGATSAGANAGGSAGTPSSVCLEPWTTGTVVYQAPAGADLGSPTVAADQLEMFFEQTDPSAQGAEHFMRATRTAADGDFSNPAIVPELDAACASSDIRSISLSPDALRAYIVCYASQTTNSNGPLQIARRASRTDPFVLDAMTYGTVGASVAPSANELQVVSSSEQDATGTAPPLLYLRSSLNDPFGTGTPIPGFEQIYLVAPELGPDNLTLFGAVSGNIVVASRTNALSTFGAPMTVFASDGTTTFFGAPEVSGDCHYLYYVHVSAATQLAYAIEMATH